MSDEISVIGDLVEAAYSNKPAWHNLGIVFDRDGTQGMTGEEAARLSHLNAWTVNKEQTFWYDKVDGIYKPVPKHYAMVRSDTRQAFPDVGVGETYKPFQNQEAFSFLDSLVMDGVLRYESAMALQGGKKIVLLARMPSVDTFADGDYGLRYLMLSAGHDGNTAIELVPTSVRVVCANTRRMALLEGKKNQTTFTVKHSSETDNRLITAKQYISQFDKAFTLYREQGQLLATRQVTTTQREEYLKTLFPPTVKDKSGELVMSTNAENRIAEVKAFAINPANVLRPIEGSWWSLYNAVTMAVDHGVKFTTRGSKEDGGPDGLTFKENKFESLMGGRLAALKDSAFTLACDMAGIAA